MSNKEYRVFELDKYDNGWFAMSFSGIPEIQKKNAERFVENEVRKNPDLRFKIEEHG